MTPRNTRFGPASWPDTADNSDNPESSACPGPNVLILEMPNTSVLPPAEWFDDAPLTAEEQLLATRRQH